MSRIEQSGRMSLRRPKPPIKRGSAPEEEEEEEEEEEVNKCSLFWFISHDYIKTHGAKTKNQTQHTQPYSPLSSDHLPLPSLPLQSLNNYFLSPIKTNLLPGI